MDIWRRLSSGSISRLLVDIFMVIFGIGAILIIHILVRPRKQGFFCNDVSIKYPYVDSTISNDVIVSVTLVAPVTLMFLVELLSRKFLRPNNELTHRGTPNRAPMGYPTLRNLAEIYQTYFWGYLALTLAVLVLKVTTGQLRPHFLAVCRPEVDWVTCKGYASDYNCTNPEVSERELDIARQSFPSGYSACATYMAVFIILSPQQMYTEVRLKTQHCRLLKLTSHAVLTLYALWCSVTRVSDHMHHMSDVVAGAVLGLLLAGLMFSQRVLPPLHIVTRVPRPDIESRGAAYHNMDQEGQKSAITISTDHAVDTDNDDKSTTTTTDNNDD